MATAKKEEKNITLVRNQRNIMLRLEKLIQ